MARTNRYAAECQTCRSNVPAGAGILTKEGGAWVVTCSTSCESQPRIDPAAAENDYLEAQGFDMLGTPCKVLYEALIAGGFANPVSVPAPEPVSTRTARPARRGTRRRKACVTGGNCSSYSGRHCGGYNCDAN